MKLKYPNKSHKGKAGRKVVPFPEFIKKLRATPAERKEFMSMLTGDARKDFEILFKALKVSI